MPGPTRGGGVDVELPDDVPRSPFAVEGKTPSVRTPAICFTIANYSFEEECQLRLSLEEPCVMYAYIGRNVGREGTPHLQGYLRLRRSHFAAGNGTLAAWRQRFLGLGRAYVAAARGTAADSKRFCAKEELVYCVENPFDRRALIWHQMRQARTLDEAAAIDPETCVKSSAAVRAILEKNKLVQISLHRMPANDPHNQLVPWQIEVLRKLRDQNSRQILIVVSESGNAGKSRLARWLRCNWAAFSVPGDCGEKDMVRRLTEHQHREYICIDYFRSMDLKKIPWALLENIKKDRVEAQKRRALPMNNPKIVLFMCAIPDGLEKKDQSADVVFHILYYQFSESDLVDVPKDIRDVTEEIHSSV